MFSATLLYIVIRTNGQLLTSSHATSLTDRTVLSYRIMPINMGDVLAECSFLVRSPDVVCGGRGPLAFHDLHGLRPAGKGTCLRIISLSLSNCFSDSSSIDAAYIGTLWFGTKTFP